MKAKVIGPRSGKYGIILFDYLFLAGTIEMGNSRDWQAYVIEQLQDCSLNIFNPRREENPVVKGKTEIKYQIKWELKHIRHSDVVLMHFEKNTISPISLLELGLLLGEQRLTSSDNLLVSCDPEYSRRDNVLLTCEEYGLSVFNDLDEAINILKERYNKLK